MFFATGHTRAANRIGGLLPIAVSLLWVPYLVAGRPAPVEPESRSLYLNVEKGEGLVTGLGPKNFRLWVDGKLTPFRLEAPEQPASIALLIEFSRSSGYYFDDFNAAMNGFMKHAPEGHWYALATYSMSLTIDADFTQSTGEIAAAYAQLGMPTWNEINTYDAIYEMLDKMGRLPGRRILIVVASGIDTFSEHTLDEVNRKLEGSNVNVFVAGAGSPFRGMYSASLGTSARMNLLQAQAFLQNLANISGGFAWFPNQYAAFPGIMQGIMQSIACQYRLVYESPVPMDGKLHKIKVEAFRFLDDKREDFKVLVRSGFR
ncbi:MAG: hypothetical protein KGN84_13150 [Acidobacteriota bacterium]|nr:hypothetical protein [Acidobacteriota bacterium]